MKGFKNTWIVTEKGLEKTSLTYDEKFVTIGKNEEGLQELPEEYVVVPGFIDEHVHGAAGSDAMDGTMEDLGKIANALASEGTTAFLATTMTQSPENITKALKAVKAYRELSPESGAEILGVHLEGPFISKDFVGAQPIEYLAKPSVEVFKKYQDASGDCVRIVTLAPEVEGSTELIKYLVSQNIVASIGHTNATYVDVKKAVEVGATNLTHTYNAMKPLHHREVGTVGSGFLFDELNCECICDGIHVSGPAIQLLHKNKPADKMTLITDAMRAKHMPDGVSELGGQVVIVKNGEARLENGTLAGSVLKMNNAVKNVMKFLNLPLEEVVKLASQNPAKNLGVFDQMGSIKEGKRADFVILDKDLNVVQTVRNGKVIYTNKQ
ncbi:MAG: N-acetylglucosamine-6-phosphate deacetylase [Acholeplasmatales bacterium]|jgi:N-acetylglucosamine-6-phosphate deacetylase|nr:N-acetylglucosamine-6-phosphate deacetylase [Acholeplasmatales bacterium]MDD7395405.1 N-acetylglucosamine-6-phosphate deacetylase [Acholeplasmatales bacterium]MDY4017205.1 N-acetylglucosamine-6-phosphate deacetylase [Bacilli bacterium]HCX08281.1 N-acetylglucosamine-6-phosphate deacetylase [Acholeplasmatales bacterium]